MTRPISSSKLLLVADRRAGTREPGSAPVRRYRLARVRFDGRAAGSGSRFEQLKQVFD